MKSNIQRLKEIAQAEHEYAVKYERYNTRLVEGIKDEILLTLDGQTKRKLLNLLTSYNRCDDVQSQGD